MKGADTMFWRKKRIEVVKPEDYTDFSERFAEWERERRGEGGYATRLDVAVGTGLSASAGIGFVAYNELEKMRAKEGVEGIGSTGVDSVSNVDGGNISEGFTLLQVNAGGGGSGGGTGGEWAMQPTGFIAETSLEVLATILDPVVQILVAISFPVASVIMVGACFFFMFGNSEKAWSMIQNAGLGYVLIQLSPLFLNILREVGKAVAS